MRDHIFLPVLLIPVLTWARVLTVLRQLGVPGGGCGDSEFLFVPWIVRPGCVLPVDQKYPLAFFFLTLSWVQVYGRKEAGGGKVCNVDQQAVSGYQALPSLTSRPQTVPVSLGGRAGGQGGPPARSQQSARASENCQTHSASGPPEAVPGTVTSALLSATTV